MLRPPPRSPLFPYTTLFRSLTRDPDITRLLDRLEARALVSRARGRADRRVVETRITPAGLRILKERSEEHTSELQSHSDLVCRLLLEKKKKKTNNQQDDKNT